MTNDLLPDGRLRGPRTALLIAYKSPKTGRYQSVENNPAPDSISINVASAIHYCCPRRRGLPGGAWLFMLQAAHTAEAIAMHSRQQKTTLYSAKTNRSNCLLFKWAVTVACLCNTQQTTEYQRYSAKANSSSCLLFKWVTAVCLCWGKWSSGGPRKHGALTQMLFQYWTSVEDDWPILKQLRWMPYVGWRESVRPTVDWMSLQKKLCDSNRSNSLKHTT